MEPVPDITPEEISELDCWNEVNQMIVYYAHNNIKCKELLTNFISYYFNNISNDVCGLLHYYYMRYPECKPKENQPSTPTAPTPTPTNPINYTPPQATEPAPVHGFELVEQSIDKVYYYHSDHLNSSTYVTDDNGRPVAYYDYLPFGEVAVEHNQTTNFNNGYKFNAKELDEATGMSYYGARYYDSRLSVFISLDPLVEQTFEPYSYVGNNPVMFTDPTGMSPEHIDVTKNEDGTYKVVGGQANSDKNIYVVDGNGKRTGEVLGQMLTEYSFHDEDGKAIVGAKIDLNDKSGQNFFNNEIKNIGLFEYINNAKGGEPLDFKRNGTVKGDRNYDNTLYHYRGMPFGGKIASARDIGNYAAGYVAGVHGLNWGTARFGFDALETKQSNGWNLFNWMSNWKVEGQPTQRAEWAGHKMGYSIFKQRQFERQWKKATNPWSTGVRW